MTERPNAISKLVTGPAKAVRAVSFLGSRKLNGSIGTGFAAPNIIPAWVMAYINGRAIVINGSICGRGSSVSLPNSLAVGSPDRSATTPCAIS